MELQITSRDLGPCLVCGDTAVGINFSVPTCPPCKAFFRRNAVKLGKVDFICEQDGDCPVTFESRRTCNCCRLAKCFRIGMDKSLIRTEEQKNERKQLVQSNKLKRKQLNIFQSIGLIQPSKRLRSICQESEYLRVSDQMLLTNILGAYEQACINGKIKNLYFPSREHTCPHTFFNEYRDREITLIEYFKLIPEFNRLSIDDEVRLIRNHFGTMYYINEPILAQTQSNNLVSSLYKSFNTNLATNMLHSIDLMFAYANDPLLLKLILIVRSFSSSINRYRNDTNMDRIYDDTRAIFSSQNKYVELLWRYILYRSSSERDAIKFFNQLIMNILFVQQTCLMADRYLYSLQDEIEQLEPLMQSMWPKTNELQVIQYNDLNINI